MSMQATGFAGTVNKNHDSAQVTSYCIINRMPLELSQVASMKPVEDKEIIVR